MMVEGKRAWVPYEDVFLDSSDFEQMGSAFEATGAAKIGRVGNAPAQLMGQVQLVDFATQWIGRHRQ